ncbi:M16 family metallopeptidase [Paludisphaera mucosa]|uniref:Pitrilysin family protein n=1 Tax=Paludisphaera mucosa TaxID=3030827 RepID=A0ABT6F6B7_9BACT|nr:pitrilysin family protein [Paludisphaera mucosa]MDG3003127.1 pitrilysin family protein [Paludisphaera mucosa]
MTTALPRRPAAAALLAMVLVATTCAAESPDAQVVLVPTSGPLVSLRLVFRVGSQDDPKGKEGLAALTAAMVAQGGTKTLKYEQVLDRFFPIAAALDGNCLKEVSVFSGSVHRDNLGVFIPLATEMIASPRFATEDFERLRDEALDHLTKTLRGNNDEALGKWTLQTSLYEGHPYGRPDTGLVAGLKAITLDDVKDFHRRHYTREALWLGLAGAADPGTVGLVEAGLTPLARVSEVKSVAPPPVAPNAGLDVTIVAKPADATAISIGFPITLTRSDDDFYALAVANSFLGEHRTFNGRLMQDLRGQRGLNYGDYSYIEDFIQEGQSTFPIPNNHRSQQYFSIWVRPVPTDKAVFALRAALWELDRLVEKGMTAEEFEATRSFLLNYSKLWVQTLSRRLGYEIEGRLYDRKNLVAELADRLPRLTVDQVNAAVRKHLKPSGLKVAIVAGNAEELRGLLIAAKPSPIVYDTQGTSADVLAQDREIEVFPLRDVKVRIVPVEQMFEK